MHWNGWSMDRIVVLFVALAYLLIWVQVTLMHYRQNFHHKAMWAPVASAPVFGVTGLALAFWGGSWLYGFFMVLMWIGSVIGLVGFYFHFHGVGVRVGGYELRNFMIGPPVIFPLIFSAIGILALIALYWR
jgi:hypothetical protein